MSLCGANQSAACSSGTSRGRGNDLACHRGNQCRNGETTVCRSTNETINLSLSLENYAVAIGQVNPIPHQSDWCRAILSRHQSMKRWTVFLRFMTHTGINFDKKPGNAEKSIKLWSTKHALIDPVILNFDLLTPKPRHFYDIPRSFPITRFEHFGS